ncbi:MAG: HU family DNA-binding protein [Phycisphaeraceae bacterium]|nr:HU family DNA-binding protein [Phycisphaeraceae bacterium]
MATSTAKARSKGATIAEIVKSTGLPRKQVVAVLDSLITIMKKDLGKRGPGVFKLMGLLKLTTVIKPATKARMGRNPFTGEEVMIKAKPASRKVRARALKALNAMV